MGEHYKSYEDVLHALEKKKRQVHLLLGNGFSMAYDPKIFSYNALFNFVAALGDPALTKLFEAVKTKNFEAVMSQLEMFISLLDAFESTEGLQDRVRHASVKLKQSLLDAVGALHPDHVFKMPEESVRNCAGFLNSYLTTGGSIFTTNYDLLLYWVLLRGAVPNHVDGFGRELLNPVEAMHGGDQKWSELRWGPNQERQNIHYLHGALPFFDTGAEIIKEEYSGDAFLLERVAARLKKGEYPVFVTAGNGDEKLERIRHNRYLSFCYDKLCKAEGSIVSFGFKFGNYDLHVIDAINKAAKYGATQPDRLWSVYIGIFSADDANHIANIEGQFRCKVNTFDARTALVWG
jgi:hypothetical protein